MFTGIIEDVGRVDRWEIRGRSGVLTIKSAISLREVGLGSSIAVNGACLTVVKKSRGRFTVDVSPETLERTNFKDMRLRDPVNLERPLRLSDRLGGHLVTGHVDAVGITEEIKKSGEFTFFSFRVPAAFDPLLVPKGSVAVDGISLTVNECAGGLFSITAIPYTLKHTNLHRCRVGDRVNIEIDIIGKYVQRLMSDKSSKTDKSFT